MNKRKRTAVYCIFIPAIFVIASGRLFQAMRVQCLNRELIMACSRLDAAEVRRTLEAGASADAANHWIWPQPSLIDRARMLFARTPLESAYYHASALRMAFEATFRDQSQGEQRLLPVMRELLDHGASPNVRSMEMRALVDEMSESHYERCCVFLLEHGAVPDEPGRCLGRACDIGDIPMARLLLKRGASPNAQVRLSCGFSSTPLGYSIYRGDSAMASLLLESGADPNQSMIGDGIKCLLIARGMHNPAMVALLKKHGAKE